MMMIMMINIKPYNTIGIWYVSVDILIADSPVWLQIMFYFLLLFVSLLLTECSTFICLYLITNLSVVTDKLQWYQSEPDIGLGVRVLANWTRETWVQSQVESYQRLKNGTWCLLA